MKTNFNGFLKNTEGMAGSIVRYRKEFFNVSK
jgi:hypothetical protein